MDSVMFMGTHYVRTYYVSTFANTLLATRLPQRMLARNLHGCEGSERS